MKQLKYNECVYSGISDSGCSEIRTISLQRTQLEVPKYFLPVVPIHFGLPNYKDMLLTKGTMTVPKCPLFGDSTVHIMHGSDIQVAAFVSFNSY